MKILCVMTGGTIGSALKDNFIDTSRGAESEIKKIIGSYDVEADVIAPYTVLSENLSLAHVLSLAACIKKNIRKEHTGVLITHGTDTLQYTAAGLYYLLESLSVPVLLVSANFVLSDKRSNGAANLSGALEFLRSKPTPGVFIPYKNNITPDGKYTEGLIKASPVVLYNAERTLAHAAYSDALSSLPPEEIKKGEDISSKRQFISNREIFSQVFEEMISEKLPGLLELPDDKIFDAVRKLKLRTEGPLFFHIHPGMYYPEPKADMGAILIETYHSGTLPMEREAFRVFLRSARNIELPVFLIGCPMDEERYKSTADYEKEGLYILKKASPVAMYMKLSLCLIFGLDPIVYM